VPWSFPLHLFIGRFSRKFHFFEEDLGKFSGHGDPQDLAEIGFLNGKGMEGLRGWFRAHYLAKIIGEMKRDRPYNACLPVGKVCEAELQNSPESLTGLTQFVICAIVLL
jgi:hypothetical protein